MLFKKLFCVTFSTVMIVFKLSMTSKNHGLTFRRLF